LKLERKGKMENNYPLLDSKLTVDEQDELEACESVIQTGLQTFVEVGSALMIIRDKRYYRLTHSTFEDYCQDRWGMSKSHANRLIRASEVIENLTPFGVIPSSESQVRPLSELESEQQSLAWQDAIDQSANGKPTSTEVKRVVEQYKKVEIISATPNKPPYCTVSEWANMSLVERSDILQLEGDKHFNKQDSDNIEWARWSWNPVTGCLHNCAYCYARDIANRFYPQGFEPVFIPERLNAPSNTKLPDLDKFDNPVDKVGWRNVFTCSMADLFGKWVPQEWIEAVLEQVRNNPQWTFLFLTKFPIRMAEFEYPSNVWLGTSVDYQWAVERAEKAFTKIKASGFSGVCWLSCEPMMERLTFSSLDMFDWVVMGGSSKSTQTPEFKPPFEWINHLYNQARGANCEIYQKTNLLGTRELGYPIQDKD